MNVTELIGDAYKNWTTDDIITIKAGTGQGKSYFIMNTLYGYAKANNQKILFLIHRTNCIDQFRHDLQKENKTDVIHLQTYQHIEANNNFDFSKYTYIVSDEFHYFIGDASFNPQTDISFHKILEQTQTIKIFMSATGDYVTKFLTNVLKLNTKEYSLPIKYDFINNVNFFGKNETLQLLIKDSVKDNRKTIVFLDSAQQAYELHKKYKNISLFNCSKNNKLYKHVDQEKIKEMLHNEKFNELLLFTTTCMDAGINIKDESLTKVICDIKDTNTLIQCLGRKRMLNENDKIDVYIKTMNKHVLGGKYKQAIDKKERAKYLKSHTIQEYIIKYGRKKDTTQIVYDLPIENEKDKLTKKVNDLMYYKYLTEGMEVEIIQSHQFGHSEYLSNVLNINKYTLIEKEFKNMNLEDYLNNIVGKVMLTVKDRAELINVINVKQNGRLLKSRDSLNAALNERKIYFYIEEFETSRIVEGKKKNFKSAWRVLKLTEN